MGIRAILYRLASLLGDLDAVKNNKIPQRLARKAMHRAVGSLLSKVLR